MTITHPLLSPFQIEADSDQFTLVRIGTIASGKNQGDRSETVLGYFTTLESCLKKVAKEQILAENEQIGLDNYIKVWTDKLEAFKSFQLEEA